MMEAKKKAIGAAAVGTALGVAGLTALAVPAGAGEPPDLPPVSAESLVQSAMTAKSPAMDGTVTLNNNMGLPAVPGMDQLNMKSAKVFHDGNGASRVSMEQSDSDQTLVRNGDTVWSYNSAENTATKFTIPADAGAQHAPGAASPEMSDPATAASQLIAKMRETSEVAVDGTARVADRPAYELVLTPKPTERTVLRDVRVAIDSETKLPLRVSVQTNGTTEPAAQVGFSDIHFADQQPELFNFTPPTGAKVTEHEAKQQEHGGTDVQPSFVGDGWDTVVTGQIPAGWLAADKPAGGKPASDEGNSENMDPKALLDQFGKPVSGAFGTGHLVTTKVGTALITDDGRFAAGAVPEQVVLEALGAK